MRRSFILVLALVTAGAVLMAQTATHDNAVEKKASDEVRFSSDLKVGNTVLKVGRYRIACDTKVIKFYLLTMAPGQYSENETKVLEVPCLGKHLDARHENTELVMPEGKDNVRVLDRLLLKGSNVEHVFPN